MAIFVEKNGERREERLEILIAAHLAFFLLAR
jgi:hypothetical protein